MNSFSKKVVVPFVCAVFVVAGSLSFTAQSLAQEKAKAKQKSDKERIAVLESAMQASKEQARVIAALQQRVTQLEQQNAQLDQRAIQRQQELANTHQRDIMSLNQQIMMLDQQVRMRRN